MGLTAQQRYYRSNRELCNARTAICKSRKPSWYSQNKAKHKANTAAYFAKFPEKKKSYAKKYHVSRRTMVSEFKNRPCLRCHGTFPPCCMDFHHRNPEEKSFEISQSMCRSYEALVSEISKCDVLCTNCHRIIEHLPEEF